MSNINDFEIENGVLKKPVPSIRSKAIFSPLLSWIVEISCPLADFVWQWKPVAWL